MEERRPFPRHKQRLRVRFCTRGGGWHSTFTLDVSVSGLFLSSRSPVPAGTPMDLEVELPGGEVLRLAGLSTWEKKVPAALRSTVPQGFGVRLTHAPEGWYRAFAGGPLESPQRPD